MINHYDRYKSFSKTSKEFIVARKTLRQWVASRELLKKSTMKLKRTQVQYKSKKVAFPDMEKELFAWIKEARMRGACVGDREIKLKALKLLEKTNEFNASNGWLAYFLRRHKLSLRRVTSTGAAKPKNFVQIVKNFVDDFQSNLLPRAQIFNMDETSIYLYSPRTTPDTANLANDSFLKLPERSGLEERSWNVHEHSGTFRNI